MTVAAAGVTATPRVRVPAGMRRCRRCEVTATTCHRETSKVDRGRRAVLGAGVAALGVVGGPVGATLRLPWGEGTPSRDSGEACAVSLEEAYVKRKAPGRIEESLPVIVQARKEAGRVGRLLLLPFEGDAAEKEDAFRAAARDRWFGARAMLTSDAIGSVRGSMNSVTGSLEVAAGLSPSLPGDPSDINKFRAAQAAVFAATEKLYVALQRGARGEKGVTQVTLLDQAKNLTDAYDAYLALVPEDLVRAASEALEAQEADDGTETVAPPE